MQTFEEINEFHFREKISFIKAWVNLFFFVNFDDLKGRKCYFLPYMNDKLTRIQLFL